MAQQRTPRSSWMRTWARPIPGWCPTFCSDGSAGLWLVVVQSTSGMRGAGIVGKPVDIGQVLQRRGDGYRGEDLWPDADDLLASLVGSSRENRCRHPLSLLQLAADGWRRASDRLAEPLCKLRRNLRDQTKGRPTCQQIVSSVPAGGLALHHGALSYNLPEQGRCGWRARRQRIQWRRWLCWVGGGSWREWTVSRCWDGRHPRPCRRSSARIHSGSRRGTQPVGRRGPRSGRPATWLSPRPSRCPSTVAWPRGRRPLRRSSWPEWNVPVGGARRCSDRLSGVEADIVGRHARSSSPCLARWASWLSGKSTARYPAAVRYQGRKVPLCGPEPSTLAMPPTMALRPIGVASTMTRPRVGSVGFDPIPPRVPNTA
jgi:hypothetical protein